MKRLLSFILVLMMALPLAAQNVNAEYDRNALTVIGVHHGDRYDAITDNYLQKYFPGRDKFDNNAVSPVYVQVGYSRFEKREDNDARSFAVNHSSGIGSLLNQGKVPQQVIGRWFNRSQSGTMDLSLINKRAEYNATDQTFNIASAQALGEYLLHGDGIKLVDNSYVLVVDHSVPVREETRDSDTGKVTAVRWNTYAMGYLYKIDFKDAQRQALYAQWIYDTDDEATRKAKAAAFYTLDYPLHLVGLDAVLTGASYSTQDKNASDQKTMEDAVKGCSRALIDHFEGKLEAWKVKTTIYKTSPVVSKVGKKEGLANLSRFEVMEYVLDQQGNVTTRRKGFVRATEIADNTRSTKGKSPMSEFYQIAGGQLEPGMLLKEKKSANFDLKALFYGGAAKGAGLEADILLGMKTWGGCSHVRIGGTFWPYKAGSTGPVQSDGTVYQLNTDINAIAVRMGFGYGLRPIRQVEFIPTAYLLADFLDSKITEGEKQNSAFTKAGWGIEAGVDANITVFYPVKINVGAYYSAPLVGGALWQVYRDALKNLGQNRMGFTWRAGLVYEF